MRAGAAFQGTSGGARKKSANVNGGNGNGSALASGGSGGTGLSAWGRDASMEGSCGIGGWGSAGGACAAGAVKRKRADSPPTKDKEREVDRNRINKRDMWSYACMSQVSMDDLERQALLEQHEQHQQVANPWEWTRKLIVRPTGAPSPASSASLPLRPWLHVFIPSRRRTACPLPCPASLHARRRASKTCAAGRARAKRRPGGCLQQCGRAPRWAIGGRGPRGGAREQRA